MRTDISYSQWLAMSDDDRENIRHSWNPYKGDGTELLKTAFERFKEQFGTQEGVMNLHCGVYHGGALVIGVTVRRGIRTKIPRSFEGFPIIKLVKDAEIAKPKKN